MREGFRDLCLFACVEFIPLMRLGLGGGFTMKLLAALFLKMHLFAALPSTKAYVWLQMAAAGSLVLHAFGRGLGAPQLPQHRAPKQAPGVSLLNLPGNIPSGLIILLEPLVIVAFALLTLDSPFHAPIAPFPSRDITDFLVSLGIRQWINDAPFTLPIVAAAAMRLQPLFDWDATPRDAQEPLLTFSRVRLPGTKRLPVPSALSMAFDLQSDSSRLSAAKAERNTA